MKLRGFTIVEVVVAVAIVTLLAAIVIPDLWAAQQRITGEMFMNNVHDITTTLELYKKEHVGLYPAQLEELASYFDKQPINQYTKSSMLTSDSYQSGVQYTPSADRKSYTLVVTQRDVNDLDRDKNKTETVAEALGQPFSFVNVQPITPTVARTYIVTLRAVPNNTGQLVAFPNPAKAEQTVMLSQIPDRCYTFNGWSSTDVTIIDNKFVMPARDVLITANYTVKSYTISATVNNLTYGIVTGAGTYDCGTTATLEAISLSGYRFIGWYENGSVVSTNTTYTFTVNGSRTLEARFSAIQYNITLKANPTSGGTPSASPNPAYVGQTVTLTANPGSCYNFSSWTAPSGVTITNNSFVMPAQNVTATANYAIKTYTITTTITKTGNSPNTPGTVSGAGTYNCGSSATLVATPATGFSFTGWYEGTAQVSTSATYTFAVSGPRTLEARFGANTYTITLKTNPTGAGSPSASPNPANVGQTVTLTANPGSCYDFSSWTVSAGTLSGNTLTMPAQNVTATANYTVKTYTIAVNITKTGNSPNTPGTATGAGTYNCGSPATLVATPATGFSFAGWYEGTKRVSTNATYTFTVSGNRTLKARFSAIAYNITFVSSPTGAGSPSASPNPANVGQTVTLSANPGTNYNFSSWSAPAGVTITNNSFVMPAQSVTITANYVPKSYTITLKSNPTGAGSPSASPNPANVGQTVTLSANPGSCYNFSSWSAPSGVTITNNSFVMPAQNVTATANYAIKTYTITTTITKTGNSPNTPGTVSGAGTYNCGSSATLVATPATGFSFTGWYEGTTRVSTNATYTFTVNGSRTLEARFSANTYTITLKANPTGAGSPSASPNPANVGQTVTLSANPGSCYNFSSWSAPSGVTITNNSFVMPAQNVTATANYTVKTYTIATTITKTGNSPNTPGTVSGAGTYNCGSSATLVATPATGFNFAGWYEGTKRVSTNATYTFTVSGNRTLKARFSAIAYNITFVSSPTGAGSPSASPNPANVGQTVTLSANPGTNYNFSSWSAPAGVTITNNSFVMPAQSVTITANYVPKSYTITLKSNPTGAGSPSASPNPATAGQTVTLTANPGSCYNFSSWSVSAGTLSGNTLTMPAQNVTVTANYTVKTYTIAVNITKTGNSPNTPGTATGAGTYNCGSPATLTAVPATGFSFAGWYEGTTQVSTNTTYSFTVNGARTLEARFNAIQYNITLVSNPTGAGSPSAAPNPAYVGQTVTLSAHTKICYTFNNWLVSAGTLNGDILTMPAQNVTVTANYTLQKYTITITVNNLSDSPNTPGTITGAGLYDCGTTATLTVVPSSGFYFIGWYIGTTQVSTNTTYYYTIYNNRTIEARFGAYDYKVTVVANPTGAGSPVATPQYAAVGETVTLTPNPSSNYNFSSWSAPAGITITNNSFVMPAQSVTITANYVPKSYTITLKSNPTGAGSPSASPNPATAGQTVTLTANPGSCYNFSSWTVSAGTLSGNTLTMPAQNVTVTANYTVKSYTISLSVNNSAYGTVSGGGSYNCGSSATVVATPATGYNFLGWYEGTTRVSTNATYTFTVNGNRTLQARFGVSASSYTITIVYEAEVPPSGNIATVSKNPASPGESVTLTIDKSAISSCYLYGGWRSPDLGQINYNFSRSYTFTMPAQNVTIYVNLPTNPNYICR